MKKKILIVEDEFPVIHSLSKELGSDYDIIEAVNGVSGLNAALQLHPDLILLDLLLPEMTGEDMLTKLRDDSWGKTAKVLVITNLSDMEIEKKMNSLGILEYLVKSNTSIKDLSKKVANHLKDNL